MNKFNKITQDYFNLSPLNNLKSINGIDVPVVAEYNSEKDKIVTDKTQKNIIETVFAQKSLSSIKKNKQGSFAKGGVVNINEETQEVWTPREFLYRQFNPDWKENPYIVTEEVAQEKLKDVALKQEELQLFIDALLEKHKANNIFALPLTDYDEIKDKRKEIESIGNFLTIAELDAYVFAHSELVKENYIDDYTYSKEDLIDKKLLFWQQDGEDGKWVYRYEYLMGDVNDKIADINRNEDRYVSNTSKEQVALQLAELESVKISYARVTTDGQNAITIKANSDFGTNTEVFFIKEIVGAMELNGRTSITSAFISYLTSDLIDPTSFQLVESYRDIVEYYCRGNTPPSDGTVEGERNKINTLQNAQIEGQRLFNLFLETELTREDKQRLEHSWNALYNNYVECQYHKIPVALSFSKTFLDKTPFIPNDTQIQSVQYASVTKSCMLAYGVGVGKTASAFMNIAWAIDNNLIKRALIVAPSNVLPKWQGEIEGKDEINALGKPTGRFMQGLLPQFPSVINLGSLNYKEVRFNLKEFTVDEERLLTKMDDLKDYIRDNVDRKRYKFDDEDVNRVILANIDDFEIDRVQVDYQNYLQPYLPDPYTGKPAKLKTKPKEIFDWWWGLQTEYINELPFRIGKLKEFPEKTVFLISHTGIGKLGAYKPNIEEDINQDDTLFGKIFYELTQGESIEEMRGYGNESGFANRLETMLFEAPKRPKVYMSNLGIDYVCFDESHFYKKAFTVSKGKVNTFRGEKADGRKYRQEKKYDIDKGQPSARSLSAYAMVRYIQEKNNNFGVLHLTATPVTNSPIEIYSMMALTNVRALYKMGFEWMEDFFDVFMRINYDIRYTAQKKIKKDQVLLGYNNTPQMRRIIFSLFDFKSGEDANIKRPIKVTYPNVPKGIDTTLTPTAEQEDAFRNIKDYIKGGLTYAEICKVSTNETTEYEELGDEELITAYEDLTGKDVDDLPPLDDKTRKKFVDKLNDAQTDTQRYSTFETEREGKGARVIKALSMMRQVTISPYLYMCMKRAEIEPTATQYVEGSPKLVYIINCIKNTLAYEKKNKLVPSGSVIFMNQGIKPEAMIPTAFETINGKEVAVAHRKQQWSQGGFQKIKQYIVDNSELEETQIGMIYGSLTKAQKVREMDKFLRGETLVLIGSKSISTGVDLQKNASTLYFADFDWNPTEADQVAGRIHRQGNRMAYTRIVYPMLENSADPVIFQILQEKSMRIREIWDKEGKTSQLDISKEFDAKDFKRKLITDPEEKADYHIEVSIKDLEDNAIMYRNRQRTFRNLGSDYETMESERGILKKGLTILEHYGKEKDRKDGIERIESKIEDIEYELEREKDDLDDKVEYLEDEIKETDVYTKEEITKKKKEVTVLKKKINEIPEKLKKKLAKTREDSYDFKNDPEKRFEYEDYTNLTDEELILKVQKVLTDSNSWYQRNVGWSEQNSIDEWIKQNYPMEYYGRDESDNEALKNLLAEKKNEIKKATVELRRIEDALLDVETFSQEEVKLEEEQDLAQEKLDDLKREFENMKDDDSGVNEDKAIRIGSRPQFQNRGYDWRNAYRNYQKGKDRILALGLDPSNLTEVLNEIATKLAEFETEIKTIKDSRDELIIKFKMEQVANRKELPTISERVVEFGSANDKYLTKFLSTFKIDTTPTVGSESTKDSSTVIKIGMTKPVNYVGEIIIELDAPKKQTIDILVGDDEWEIYGGEEFSLGEYTVAEFEKLLVDNDELGTFEFFEWAIKDGVQGGKPKLKQAPVVEPPVDKPEEQPEEGNLVEEYQMKIELYEDLLEIAETDEEIAELQLKIDLYQDLIDLEE